LSGEELPAGPSLNPAIDGYAITADRNIIHTRATLNYHIDDPIRYVFNFASASNTMQNALNNALLYTAAQFNVDDILYARRGRVPGSRATARQRFDRPGAPARHHRRGQCQVESTPPRQLQDVFDQVTEARQNQNKVLDDAHSYDKPGHQQRRGAGFNHHQRRPEPPPRRYVQSVQADAKAFSDLLPAITKSIRACFRSKNWCR
jgi:hypothetical protein